MWSNHHQACFGGTHGCWKCFEGSKFLAHKTTCVGTKVACSRNLLNQDSALDISFSNLEFKNGHSMRVPIQPRFTVLVGGWQAMDPKRQKGTSCTVTAKKLEPLIWGNYGLTIPTLSIKKNRTTKVVKKLKNGKTKKSFQGVKDKLKDTQHLG